MSEADEEVLRFREAVKPMIAKRLFHAFKSQYVLLKKLTFKENLGPGDWRFECEVFYGGEDIRPSHRLKSVVRDGDTFTFTSEPPRGKYE